MSSTEKLQEQGDFQNKGIGVLHHKTMRYSVGWRERERESVCVCVGVCEVVCVCKCDKLLNGT